MRGMDNCEYAAQCLQSRATTYLFFLRARTVLELYTLSGCSAARAVSCAALAHSDRNLKLIPTSECSVGLTSITLRHRCAHYQWCERAHIKYEKVSLRNPRRSAFENYSASRPIRRHVHSNVRPPGPSSAMFRRTPTELSEALSTLSLAPLSSLRPPLQVSTPLPTCPLPCEPTNEQVAPLLVTIQRAADGGHLASARDDLEHEGGVAWNAVDVAIVCQHS